jgi:hypothetical protein
VRFAREVVGAERMIHGGSSTILTLAQAGTHLRLTFGRRRNTKRTKSETRTQGLNGGIRGLEPLCFLRIFVLSVLHPLVLACGRRNTKSTKMGTEHKEAAVSRHTMFGTPCLAPCLDIHRLGALTILPRTMFGHPPPCLDIHHHVWTSTDLVR